jgi:integrase
MPRPRKSVPTYSLHAASGQACVYINRKRVYLGPHGSLESRQRYSEIIAGAAFSGPAQAAAAPLSLTVNELLLRFVTERLPKYVDRDGKPSAEQACYLGVIRIVRELFGEDAAASFGPLKFRLCRKRMIELGWARQHINKQCQRLRALFKFAAGWELVPAAVHEALRAVEPLRPGDSTARETQRRQAVPLENIEATKQHLRARNRDLVDLLLATAARPSELLSLTTAMIQNRSERDGVWIVQLAHHKTAHHGHDRRLLFNQAAQQILLKYLDLTHPQQLLFPMQRKTLGTAIKDASIKAGVPPFSSHWLRHTAITMLADNAGVEAAQRVAGHATISMTSHYSRSADSQAVAAVKRLG